MTDRLERYLPHLYRFALRLTGDRHLAEDLAHDTMVRALENAGRLRSNEAARTWLFRIAANLHMDQRRRTLTARKIMPGIAKPVSAPCNHERLETLEDAQSALAVMNALPERQRAVLHLFAVEELSIAEITDVLGITRENVRANLHYAREAVRKRLPQLWNPMTQSQAGDSKDE